MRHFGGCGVYQRLPGLGLPEGALHYAVPSQSATNVTLISFRDSSWKLGKRPATMHRIPRHLGD